MAVNWFEGGRRTSQLAIGLVALGGAVIVLSTEQPDPEFTTYGPSAPWMVSSEPCPDEAHLERIWDYDWGGEERGIGLCFIPFAHDQFAYADAEPPPEALEQAKERSRRFQEENDARVARGDPPMIPPPLPSWAYTAEEYSPVFLSYVGERKSAFEVTPELREAALDRQSGALWEARKASFGAVASWVFGICIFLWAFTLAMGWIVRGFAGVPSGRDFRTDP